MPRTLVLRACLLIVAALLAAAPTHVRADPQPPLILAAASLKTVLDSIISKLSVAAPQRPRIAYAGTGALVRQLEHGAPADLLVSADAAWMDYAKKRMLIDPESRRDLVGNSLVLVTPIATKLTLDISQQGSIARALGTGRLAIGNVASVPAGRYAKQALQHLSHWQALSPRLAQSENVRQALALVARAETPLGIVYATDAMAEPRVRVLAEFPAASHPPIIYSIALTSRSKSASARQIYQHLLSDAAAREFQMHGFMVLK